jgi:carbon storage regulator CsrA
MPKPPGKPGRPTDPAPPLLAPGDRVTVLSSNRPGTVLDGRCGPNGRIVVLPDRNASERHGAAVVVVEREGVRLEGEPGPVALIGSDQEMRPSGGRGMLVLSRQPGGSIVIDTGHERIEVMLVEIRGFGARLGFTAPPHVTINREEVQERIDRAARREGGAA